MFLSIEKTHDSDRFKGNAKYGNFSIRPHGQRESNDLN
jgi:hypothetical protein